MLTIRLSNNTRARLKRATKWREKIMKKIYKLPFSKVLIIGWTVYKNMLGKVLKRKFFIQIKSIYCLDCW
jgi:hypothetical protein